MSPPRRPPASRRARRPQHDWTRYAAPAAFLLAATIAILLIRSGIHGAGPATTTRATTTAAKPKPKPATTRKATTKTTTAGAAKYYTVVAGDTFSTIASK